MFFFWLRKTQKLKLVNLKKVNKIFNTPLRPLPPGEILNFARDILSILYFEVYSSIFQNL